MVLLRFKKVMNKTPFLNYFFYSILLFIYPSKLTEIDAKKNLEREFEKNQGYKDREDDKDFVKAKLGHFKDLSMERIGELRKSSLKAFILTSVFFGFSFIVAFLWLKYFELPSQNIFFFIRLISSFLILFAMFLAVGRSIHSIGGQTIPENLDIFLCKLLSALGVGAILITYFVEYLSKTKF